MCTNQIMLKNLNTFTCKRLRVEYLFEESNIGKKEALEKD